MKKKILAASIAALSTTAFTAQAQPGGEARGERPDPETVVIDIVSEYDNNTDNLIDAVELEAALMGMHEKRAERMGERMGERDGDRDRSQRGEGRDRRRPDPSQIAARLVSDFDEDGDEALNTEELHGAVSAMGPRGPRGKRGPKGDHRPRDLAPDTE